MMCLQLISCTTTDPIVTIKNSSSSLTQCRLVATVHHHHHHHHHNARVKIRNNGPNYDHSLQYSGSILNPLLMNKSRLAEGLAAANSSINSAVASTADGGLIEEDDQKKQLLVQLPEGLYQELMPKHVAIMLSGIRMWAENRGLEVELGYKAGGEATKNLVINCSTFGIKVLTLFVPSTEYSIPPKDASSFMTFLEEVAEIYSPEELIWEHDIQVCFIGDKSGLPNHAQSLISLVEESTKANKGMRLIIALNYSGRQEIVEAIKRIATKVKDGILKLEEANDKSLFDQHLETKGMDFSSPDLYIRMDGVLQLNDFMLWQLAYSELLFINKLLPDFGEADLVDALKAFQKRQRRYGTE